MAIEQQPDTPSTSTTEQLREKAPPAENVLVAHNATTGQVIGELPFADEAAVRAAVARARAAQPTWAALSFKQRGEYLIRFRDQLLEHSDSIAQLISQEVGKPQIEAMSEIMAGLDTINYYVKNAEKLLADESVPLHLLKHRKSYLHYVPLGVIGIISPWNYPFILALSEVITALIAGNTVVLKPSELTPLNGQIIADIFIKVGLPENVFQVVHGDGRTGAALVKSGVDKDTAGEPPSNGYTGERSIW